MRDRRRRRRGTAQAGCGCCQRQLVTGMDEVIGTELVPARHVVVIESVAPGDGIERVARFHGIGSRCLLQRRTILPRIPTQRASAAREQKHDAERECPPHSEPPKSGTKLTCSMSSRSWWS